MGSTTTSLESVAEAQLVSLGAFTCIISIVVGVLSLIACWKLFKKAKIAGWKALIPFYDTYLLVKMAFGNGWYFLLFLIPVFNVVFIVLFSFKFCERFKKGPGFSLGMVFFPFIFMLILAFGDAKYHAPKNTNLF